MMPPPEEVAALIERAERVVEETNGRLLRLDREDRRRLLAWAVFERLRHGYDRFPSEVLA